MSRRFLNILKASRTFKRVDQVNPQISTFGLVNMASKGPTPSDAIKSKHLLYNYYIAFFVASIIAMKFFLDGREYKCRLQIKTLLQNSNFLYVAY